MSQGRQGSASKSRGPRKSYTQFPLSRINTIMKSSPDVSNVTPEAVLLTAKAAELFVGYLAKLAHTTNESGNKKYIDYHEVANVVLSDDKLGFLKDIVPHKITVKEYKELLEEVEAKERKLNGEFDEEEEDDDNQCGDEEDCEEDGEDE